MIYIPFTPSLSEEKEMYLPSGENEGSSLFPCEVSWVSPVPSGLTINIWFVPRLPEKTILSPFGDQAGEVLYDPSKVILFISEPSFRIT